MLSFLFCFWPYWGQCGGHAGLVIWAALCAPAEGTVSFVAVPDTGRATVARPSSPGSFLLGNQRDLCPRSSWAGRQHPNQLQICLGRLQSADSGMYHPAKHSLQREEPSCILMSATEASTLSPSAFVVFGLRSLLDMVTLPLSPTDQATTLLLKLTLCHRVCHAICQDNSDFRETRISVREKVGRDVF